MIYSLEQFIKYDYKNIPVGIIDNLRRPKACHGVLSSILIKYIKELDRNEAHVRLDGCASGGNFNLPTPVEIYYFCKPEKRLKIMGFKKHSRGEENVCTGRENFIYHKPDKENRGVQFYTDFQNFDLSVRKIAEKEDEELKRFIAEKEDEELKRFLGDAKKLFDSFYL